jgi:hypothetical protein
VQSEGAPLQTPATQVEPPGQSLVALQSISTLVPQLAPPKTEAARSAESQRIANTRAMRRDDARNGARPEVSFESMIESFPAGARVARAHPEPNRLPIILLSGTNASENRGAIHFFERGSLSRARATFSRGAASRPGLVVGRATDREAPNLIPTGQRAARDEAKDACFVGERNWRGGAGRERRSFDAKRDR